mmetsp:Transcript_74007/g.128443  ORF Transcript_74007/g.128443 Transcript_74007/m.128443 type:complete len:85 (+) Transcript_74007:57-311(+)
MSSSAIVQSGDVSSKAADLLQSAGVGEGKKEKKKAKQAYMASMRSSNPAMDILRINHYAPELDVSVNAETLLLLSGPIKVESED